MVQVSKKPTFSPQKSAFFFLNFLRFLPSAYQSSHIIRRGIDQGSSKKPGSRSKTRKAIKTPKLLPVHRTHPRLFCTFDSTIPLFLFKNG